VSILYSADSWKPARQPWRTGAWFAAYVLVSIVLGGLLGAFLVRWGMEREQGFLPWLIERSGGPRVMRRVQTLTAILLAPWMLRKIGWRGWGDLGWSSSRARHDRRRDALRGYGLGLVLTGLLLMLSLAWEVRVLREFSAASWGMTFLKDVLITAIGVGIVEETFARDVLYRRLARGCTAWTGAVVTSALFAYVHFLKVRPGRFEEGMVEALQSSLFETLQLDHGVLKFLNLFLFGVLLCRMVHHRGDIWMAVGFHASAVGVIKIAARQTDVVDRAVRNPWIGHAASFDEGWLMTCLLLLLLLAGEALLSRSTGVRRRVHL